MRALPLLLPVLLLVSAAASSPDNEPTVSPQVRVRLASLGSPERFTIRGGDLRATDETGAPISIGGDAVVATAAGGKVRIGGTTAQSVRIEGSVMTVGLGKTGRGYPDALVLTAGRSGLTLSNETNLERYTEGVLAGECPSLFHPEAIRAMAIAARSYSFRKALMSRGDLCDTTHCQVYRGCTGIREPIKEAVRATTGLCATHEGEVIDAVYSSDCGGYTESNEDAWKGARPVPYLRAVEDAPEPQGEPYCAVNRSHTWSLTLSETRLKSLLGKRADTVNLEVVSLTDSGRVRQLRIGGAAAAGEGKHFSGDQWRRTIGLSTVKSLKFDIAPAATGVQLSGAGYGHGVGLCQYGANGMGKQGCTAEEILKHYYTGIEITPVPSAAQARAVVSAKRGRRS